MEIVATAEIDCEPERLFAEVVDLTRYGDWMRLVHRAEPLDDAANPAWDVELRTQVGPLNRSKRLRMERTEVIPERLAVFERVETDGREHAEWVLRVEIADASDNDGQMPGSGASPAPSGPSRRSHLTMTLSYSGSLFTATGLRPILDREIREARQRLIARFAPTR